MALITCSNCGKRVSDKAEKCIYCGYTLEDEELNVSARDAFDFACERYEEAKDLIKELSALTKTVAKDFSVKEALVQYDLFLQCILLRVALKDGLFVENEKVFIEKITDYADLMHLINNIMNDQSLSWRNIDWDDLMQMDQEIRTRISNSATVIMNNAAESFVTPFAIIDAATPRNYIEELMDITLHIVTCLGLVDGDPFKSEDLDAEIQEGIASFMVLIHQKWIEIKEKHEKLK